MEMYTTFRGKVLNRTVILFCIILGVLFNLWAYTRPLIDALVVLGNFALSLTVLAVLHFIYVKRKMKSRE